MGLLLILLLIVPRYVGTFEDFDAALPSISVVVIQVSFWVARYWYLFAILGIAEFALDCGLLLVLATSSRKGQLVLGILLAFVPLLLGGFVLLAMWIPMVELQENLN